MIKEAKVSTKKKPFFRTTPSYKEAYLEELKELQHRMELLLPDKLDLVFSMRTRMLADNVDHEIRSAEQNTSPRDEKAYEVYVQRSVARLRALLDVLDVT